MSLINRCLEIIIEEGTLLLGGDPEQTVPYFKYLLSVGPGETSILSMDPQRRRVEIFESLRKAILRGCRIHPTVFLIEDLHWIDKTSEEFLLSLADGIPSIPMLLILTCRPGYSSPLGVRDHRRIRLYNLAREESIRMAESLLETAGLSDELRELIIGRAEGNPFFIEELVKSLIESGALIRTESGYRIDKEVPGIKVPSTVQDVIMARIDRLDEDLKKTLQTGSVIGREFGFKLLQRVSGGRELIEHLNSLKDSELVYERGSLPDSDYVFKHALTHEVAYGSLLIEKRKELHERVGFAIEELYANRLEEVYCAKRKEDKCCKTQSDC